MIASKRIQASLQAAGALPVLALVALASSSLAATAYQTTPASSPANFNATSTTTIGPLWRRPGCHRVGHTRTISIPGCVKFNLSTNACRGFCRSYSVPANSNLDGLTQEPERERASLLAYDSAVAEQREPGQLLGQQQPLQPSVPTANEAGRNRKSFMAAEKAEGELLSPSSAGGAVLIVPDGPTSTKTTNEPEPQAASGRKGTQDQQQLRQPSTTSNSNSYIMGTSGGSGELTPLPKQLLRPQQTDRRPATNQLLLTGGTATPGTGSAAERRDVVSVSQCCNMMETEDVIVNLRCGANEIRRLRFKSAKTCECFFCKHF